MKIFLFLLPAAIAIQNVNTCNNNLHTAKTADVTSTNNVVADTTFATAIQQVLYYTNLERQKANLHPLTQNNKLMTVAANYAALMVKENQFSHEVNGQTLPMRFSAAGYTWRYIGENIAAGSDLNGQATVEDQWMHSSGHRANILNAKFTEIGIGIAYSSKLHMYYYCEDFGQPR